MTVMMRKGSLLVCDDNRAVLTAVRMLAENDFDSIACISNPAGIPARLREVCPDVVLLDMNFRSGINNGSEGLYWLGEIKRLRPSAEVVLITAYADIELAVEGIKRGAADFIVKPWDNGKLLDTLRSARDRHSSARPDGRKAPSAGQMVWGDSPAMQSLRTMVEKVAATDANILITGENGTGKEVLAREIHRLSLRGGAPLVPIDMGAVSESLFESELFGHVRGAFTDAKADKPGKFELAEGGTLFLDEIGNLSYSLQAKLLTALQRRQIVRVGGSRSIDIDVRLVCATNRDLQQMVADGTFREDLLYRINTICLHLPPLRERSADILPLANVFLTRYAAMYNKADVRLSDAASQKVAALPWYGNIRELQHAMERAVIMADGCVIDADDIDGGGSTHHRPEDMAAGGVQTLDEMERRMIEQAMSECGGNLSAVASRLGISTQTLYTKIRKYEI